MVVYFDIKQFYYLPQYIPVKDALAAQNINSVFVLHKQEELNDLLEKTVQDLGLFYISVDDEKQALYVYEKDKPDWIIFGNRMDGLSHVHEHSRTALMQHGIGPKSCYYDVSEGEIQYRFVEGEHRLKRLQERFPNKKFVDSGYAKLDPIINGTIDTPNLEELGLDPKKPTILYAPTFYPSSIEMLPKNWPEQLSDFNLIIKPHFFSLQKAKYKKQRDRLYGWNKFSNAYLTDVADTNILPFMHIADSMISDASSALFEFTALNKPAIWCDFYKLRWSYRGIFKKRFTKRLDDDLKYFGIVAQQVKNANDLSSTVIEQLNNPHLKEQQRLEMKELLTGVVDGQCSHRIAEFISQESVECA